MLRITRLAATLGLLAGLAAPQFAAAAIWSIKSDCSEADWTVTVHLDGFGTVDASCHDGNKVERSIDYVASSFFHPFVTRVALQDRVPGLDELNAEALLWCASIANVRTHATTGEQPKARLGAEHAAMQPFVPCAPSAKVYAWPRYPVQRSPREYEAWLHEAAR